MSADHDPREPRAGSPEPDDSPTLSRRSLLSGGLGAATADRAPLVAEEIVREHLAWAHPGLDRVVEAGGFYGTVAAATRTLLEELSPAAGSASP